MSKYYSHVRGVSSTEKISQNEVIFGKCKFLKISGFLTHYRSEKFMTFIKNIILFSL